MTEQEIIAKAKTSKALEWQSDDPAPFTYPEYWHGKVPLKVKMIRNVFPDMPFLAKENTECLRGKEYYVWVNSYGAVSAILENGEQLGLKPAEFAIIEWHT